VGEIWGIFPVHVVAKEAQKAMVVMAAIVEAAALEISWDVVVVVVVVVVVALLLLLLLLIYAPWEIDLVMHETAAAVVASLAMQ